MSAPRRSPRLAKVEAELRRHRAKANVELRRSPRLAKTVIAEAKSAARVDQAERVEITLRRSVRINKPSDGKALLRWQAFLVEIDEENTVISDITDSEYEYDSDYDTNSE